MLKRLEVVFFFSGRGRHTRLQGDWSSDVCSSDLMRRRRRAPPYERPVAPLWPWADGNLRRADSLLAAGSGGAARPVPFRELVQAVSAGLQIGRASFRGRVEISVVAVSLDKNKFSA